MTTGGNRRVTSLLVTGLVLLSLVAGAPVASASSGGTPTAVFANDSGIITVLMEDGSTKSLGVSGEYAGHMRNLDDDKYLEVPFVNSDGDIRLVDTTGETATLVRGDGDGGVNMIATGDRDGNGTPAVFYENTSDGKLYRVEHTGSPAPVLGPDGNTIATNGVLGLADYDGDGDEDLVFLGSSSTVKYYDGSTISSTGFSSFGSNNGMGVGAPADFDGDGVPRVPYVTGSNGLGLLAHNGSKTKLDSNYGDAVKAPVAADDVTGDSTPELLHVNTRNDELYYAHLNGTVDPVHDAQGDTIGTVASFGVSGAVAPPAPRISNFSVTNPTGRELRVSFDASEQLVDIQVDVTGPENVTLTEANFTESGSGPYTYTAAYRVDADGDYTATLVTAADAEGNDGADDQTDNVTIQTPSPTVRNVTVSDESDGNGIVGGNDTVRVTAEVDNQSTITNVTANASVFGAGTVTLTNGSGGYAGTFTVDDASAGPDGNRSVTVTATNEYDHSDTNESGTLFLDTTPPNPDAGQNRTVKEDTSVGFDADGSTDNTRIDRYVWHFGDGTTASGAAAVHTYDGPGTYTATLTTYDVENHSATDTRTIEVRDVTESTSSAETTDTRTVTETKVVRVEEADADGNDGSDSDNSDRPAMRVRLSTANDSTVRGDVLHARTGRSVSIPFGQLNATVDTPASLEAVEFDVHRRGNFSVRRVSRNGAPERVPALGDERAVRPLQYASLDHAVDADNVSGVSLTVSVSKAALDGANPSAIRVYRFDDGWTAHDATVVDETDDSYRLRTSVPGLSTFAIGVVQPNITVVSASLERSTIGVGDAATVTAVVENHGAAAGSKTVALRVDGAVVAQRTVSVPADGRERVVFHNSFEQPGTHAVAVEHTDAGTMHVEGAEQSPAAHFPFMLLLLGFAGYAYNSVTGRIGDRLRSFRV